MIDEDRPASGRSTIRSDIEGLRAVAVGSVLLYHAGLAWVPGGFVGVDVFFVISGFLITTLIVREVERTGRLGLRDFWARRARRLLPASTLVLVFSALVTVLWLPVTVRKIFGADIVAAALYAVNWRLGYREVDYLAEGVGSSPVQHYWSLAVEEQFYVVWPLLIALIVMLFRARRRTALMVGILAVSAASFAWSLYYSAAQPGLAFFVSSTRLWELGVGALLAISFPTLVRRVPAVARAGLGWAGLAAITIAVLTYDSTVTWPGAATLLPVLGTAAAILGGGTREDAGDQRQVARRGAGRLLGLAPAVWVGGLSYSLYLWHWPFLIAAEGIWGDSLRVRHTLLVVLASAVPAWLSYTYVENPLRTSPRLRPARPALVMCAAGTLVAGVTGLAVIGSFAFVDTVDVASARQAPGAVALHDPAFADVDWASVKSVDHMRPSPLKALRDRPAIYDSGCIVNTTEERQEICEFGNPDATRTVMLVGDSKAVQWFTPIERIVREAGWRLVVIAKGNCQFADVERLSDDQPNPSCDAWSPWALEQVLDLRPEVLLTVTRWNRALPDGGRSTEDYETEPMVEGLADYWRTVAEQGTIVVPILDNVGSPTGNVPQCIQENLEQLDACSFDLAARWSTSGAPTQVAAAERVPEVRLIDMSDLLCPDGTCPPVIGNVIVYRSGTHVSDTYAATATRALAARLAKATDGLLDAR